MNPKFIVREPQDPSQVAEWHCRDHARDILGQKLMDKLENSGLQVVPSKEGLEQVFGPAAGIAASLLPRVEVVVRTDLKGTDFIEAYAFCALEIQKLGKD
ncbi:MAG: hypothetical protein KQI62_02110 [Deltaproteobacteria bacterium]|nr:hypothetical protein [Deltaproteobacteria bacterium]